MEELVSKNLQNAFLSIGLDFRLLFPESKNEITDRWYGDYEWIVRDVPGYGTVINAVPPDEHLRSKPWEEWYEHENVVHHHVLYLDKPSTYDDIFDAPEHDDIHPPRTLGKRWWVVDDPDLSPLFLR
ncbi:MAG: hypothetical protein JXQ30_03195 [Spirochaetes bacterium]|nr:hypothetical protein [Spirochaetota bacterium]